MTPLKKLFRLAALFLLAFALLPLLIVHTRLASGLVAPAIQPEQLSNRISPISAKLTNENWNDTFATAGGAIDTMELKQADNGWINGWINGCQVPPTESSPRDSPPTGLVVVLAFPPKHKVVKEDARERICQAIPSQLEYFLIPQGLDLLFLIQEEVESGWTIEHFISCWKLKPKGTKQTWKNLDGSTLTATSYQYNSEARSTIYLGRTKLEYPRYIQEDMSILSIPITPRSCQAPIEYIQATRWYTGELLRLGILQEYDYFLKIDTDILFLESIPFHILQDMETRQAVFGHTAEYHPKGSKTCVQGIQQAVANFTAKIQNQNERYGGLPSWKGSLCTISPEVQRDGDQYYTNLIIGKVDFWQSPWVLEFSDFLNEFSKGFFAYRWTDQIFWHYAMGLFLDDFPSYVMDYTNLRCMPHPNCWYSSYNFQRYGTNAWHQCDNGGYFLHPKDYEIAESKRKAPIRHLLWNATQPLFRSTYQKDCYTKL